MHNISKLLTKGIQYKVSIFANWKLGVSTNIKITVINMARKLREKWIHNKAGHQFVHTK